MKFPFLGKGHLDYFSFLEKDRLGYLSLLLGKGRLGLPLHARFDSIELILNKIIVFSPF